MLDFGAGVFTGQARWLNIEVRPTGGGIFTALAPRQEVTSSPYAIRAQAATTAASVANGAVTAGQLNTGGLPPAPGQFLSYNGGNLIWSDPAVAAGNIWSQLGTNAYYNAGNIGIGSAAPVGKLEVVGQDALRLIGFNPFLTLFDSNAGYARSRIQGVGGDVDLFTESYLNGSNPSAFLKLANNGNVGIGSATPVGKLEVVGQDAVRLIGFNPFLTFYDSSAGYARSRIQGVGGDVDLFTENYLNGSDPTAFLKLANNGHVGIGSPTPVAKLQVETSVPSETAIYGNAKAGGVGVYAQSSSGPAIHADGNATQVRDKGGFVKAMAYVDPFLPAAQYVVRCYNSQQTGNATETAPCGITVTRNYAGSYVVDFGFNVADRFISVTPTLSGTTIAAGPYPQYPNRVYVAFAQSDNTVDYKDTPFFIFVF